MRKMIRHSSLKLDMVLYCVRMCESSRRCGIMLCVVKGANVIIKSMSSNSVCEQLISTFNNDANRLYTLCWSDQEEFCVWTVDMNNDVNWLCTLCRSDQEEFCAWTVDINNVVQVIETPQLKSVALETDQRGRLPVVRNKAREKRRMFKIDGSE